MKNCLITSFGMLMVLLISPSCHKITGEGPIVAQTRDISGFTGVDVGISGNVQYIPDSLYFIEVSAQQNILDLIEMPVEAGELRIRFKNHSRLGSYEDIQISVHAPGITSLGISGSASLSITKSYHPDSLRLSIAGSGDLHTDSLFLSKNLVVSIAGSGDVFLSDLRSSGLRVDIAGSGNVVAQGGQTAEEDIRISGSGKADLSMIGSQDASIHTSGSGDTRIKATQNLEAVISGSGNVYYFGTPMITASVSGSGKLIPL